MTTTKAKADATAANERFQQAVDERERRLMSRITDLFHEEQRKILRLLVREHFSGIS